jgi:hypothetical protein
MGIGWFTLLKIVPWSEVIKNAPKVADGAVKLWSTVARKSSWPDAAQGAASPKTPGSIDARVLALEAAVADLHSQMLASSELIKALADQNAQLVRRIESNRLRLLWLSAVTALLAIAAVVILLLSFSPQGS